MDKNNLTRRQFIAAASAASLAAAASRKVPAYGNISRKVSKLAILGGEPVRKNKSWPRWPYWDENV
ncbi:MAG: twin-arginine translocation signal domain-containing protein, partial [Phycisphaerae bacterium]